MQNSSIQLVPPTLKALSGLITYNLSLHNVVANLEYACYVGNSYSMLRTLEYPQVKVATAGLGHGLTCAYTETIGSEWERRGLVWVSELACHPMCSFLGRECQGNLSGFEWLQKIYEKHTNWLDKIPFA